MTIVCECSCCNCTEPATTTDDWGVQSVTSAPATCVIDPGRYRGGRTPARKLANKERNILMTKITVTPHIGIFAGREVFTNSEGKGLFTRHDDGTPQQHTGTSQTPRFRDARHLARWLRGNYPAD